MDRLASQPPIANALKLEEMKAVAPPFIMYDVAYVLLESETLCAAKPSDVAQ